MKIKNKKFTLIELIIVIVVIAILAGMALPKFIGVRKNAEVSAMERDLDTLEKAVMMYNLDNEDNNYPFKEPTSRSVATVTGLKDSIYEALESLGDDGSEVYELDMDLLSPYLSKLKYKDDVYLYSLQSGTAIHEDGKVDGNGETHHILGRGTLTSGNDTAIEEDGVHYKTFDASNVAKWESFSYKADIPKGGKITFEWAAVENLDEVEELKKETRSKSTNWISDFESLPESRYLVSKITITSADEGQSVLKSLNVKYKVKETSDDSDLEGDSNDAADSNVTPIVSSLDDVLVASSTTTHVVGKDGELYGCGLNASSSMIGDGTYGTEKPSLTKIVLEAGVKPKSIHKASTATFALGDNGEMYVWGANTNSLLTVPTSTASQYKTPTKIELPGGVKFKEIFTNSGEDHVLAIGEDENLYGWGKNSSGQIGRGEATSYAQTTPYRITLAPGVKPVKAWVCSDRMSFALGDDGNMYGWGVTSAKLFPYSGNENTSPNKIPLPGGVKAVDAQVSSKNLIILGEDGNLYGRGINGNGVLGLGHTNQVQETTLLEIPNGEKVKSFSLDKSTGQHGTTDRDMLVAITDKGKIYASGYNFYEALGDKETLTTSVKNFIELKLPNGVKPVSALSKASKLMIQGSNGKVYVSGSNTNGTAFLDSSITNAKTLTEINLPSDVEVYGIVATDVNTFIVGTKGELYGTGSNSLCQFPNGVKGTKYTTPTLIDVTLKVNK